MSHKNHNYTKYSNHQTAPVAVTESAVDSIAASTPEPPVEPKTSDNILGVVTECVKLNVRKDPSTDSDPVAVILLGTEVMVTISESTEDFYKVCTESGVEGYCMKEYININA